MVEPGHPELSIRRQCELLGISRGTYYYEPKADQGQEDRDLMLLMEILAVLRERPFYGYRKIAYAVQHLGATRKQVRRIMHRAGLKALYPGKNLSKPKKGAKKYRYLLHDKAIWLPNQVWAADITYVRLEHGYVYLIQISMDARNRSLGNISIERFWRTLKYEDIYLKDYKDLRELREGISRSVHFYNSERIHQSLGYATPDSIYARKFSVGEQKIAA